MIRDRLTIGLGQPNLHLISRQQKQKPRTRPETLKIKDIKQGDCMIKKRKDKALPYIYPHT